MNKDRILLFEYYLLAAEVFVHGLKEEAREKASGASASGHTDTWHDEVFKMELVQKTIEATMHDQIRKRLLSPEVIWPENAVNPNIVDIGAIVTVQEDNYPEEKYLLTGDNTNSRFGFITIRSPLGQGLLHCRPGARKQIPIPAGILKLEILDVSYEISSVLNEYLVFLLDDARQGLLQGSVSQKLQELSKLRASIDKSSGNAASERDYFEGIAAMAKHTAVMEAISLIVLAYNISTDIGGESKSIVESIRGQFQIQGLKFPSLFDVPYCSPKTD